MTQMTKRLFVLFAALASTTVLAACNSPTATNTTEEPATEQASEPTEPIAVTEAPEVEPASEALATDNTDTTATPTATEAEGENIVAIASGDSTFSTLVAAINAADLAETLSAEGPYTVFAPTDEAFAALPEGTVEDLLKPENKDKLVQILKYHVVPAKVLSTEIQPGAVETVEGEALEISVNSDTNEVQVNNGKVTKTDIVGSNGVIHVIDTVLMPGAE
ncbi:beta-Ig-H3/Fasciclin domain protein [Lyngbya aestuarii BL J]|uniref:Beta-Ig-H3/Fasciclin domain protein n=2 Tax=Lyngbya aestuarii TaxID=118322 RepID=U7QGS9_9CYAN|nr:beta-Ig-H3/Fasciclin domain protein [Lyngbya aestuarii BL J]